LLQIRNPIVRARTRIYLVSWMSFPFLSLFYRLLRMKRLPGKGETWNVSPGTILTYRPCQNGVPVSRENSNWWCAIHILIPLPKLLSLPEAVFSQAGREHRSRPGKKIPLAYHPHPNQKTVWLFRCR
jgi:hypothetical protein